MEDNRIVTESLGEKYSAVLQDLGSRGFRLDIPSLSYPSYIFGGGVVYALPGSRQLNFKNFRDFTSAQAAAKSLGVEISLPQNQKGLEGASLEKFPVGGSSFT